MKTENKIIKAAGLTLGVLIVAALTVTLLNVQEDKLQAQTTNGQLTNNYSGPYYSTSNLLVAGTQQYLFSDPVAPTVAGIVASLTYTNQYYISGTNYSGGNIYPVGIKNSLNVAFGFTITATNNANKGTYTELVQGGTGFGDWTTIATLPVNTQTGTPVLNTNVTWPNIVFATNATVNVGGFAYFRIYEITSTETNYTATASASLSSKPGI